MDVLMPQLGETVAEGKITKWFKSAGDVVKPGDNLFEIETDKVSMEVPSITTGTLISVSVPVVIDGTSIDTLSVSISNRLSPGFTTSPADLNHFVILPSATVSPSCGIKTSIAGLSLYQVT